MKAKLILIVLLAFSIMVCLSQTGLARPAGTKIADVTERELVRAPGERECQDDQGNVVDAAECFLGEGTWVTITPSSMILGPVDGRACGLTTMSFYDVEHDGEFAHCSVHNDYNMWQLSSGEEGGGDNVWCGSQCVEDTANIFDVQVFPTIIANESITHREMTLGTTKEYPICYLVGMTIEEVQDEDYSQCSVSYSDEGIWKVTANAPGDEDAHCTAACIRDGNYNVFTTEEQVSAGSSDYLGPIDLGASEENGQKIRACFLTGARFNRLDDDQGMCDISVGPDGRYKMSGRGTGSADIWCSAQCISWDPVDAPIVEPSIRPIKFKQVIRE